MLQQQRRRKRKKHLRCLKSQETKMGCDIHLTLERLKKKADVETVRVRLALLICKKRLVIVE